MKAKCKITIAGVLLFLMCFGCFGCGKVDISPELIDKIEEMQNQKEEEANGEDIVSDNDSEDEKLQEEEEQESVAEKLEAKETEPEEDKATQKDEAEEETEADAVAPEELYKDILDMYYYKMSNGWDGGRMSAFFSCLMGCIVPSNHWQM